MREYRRKIPVVNIAYSILMYEDENELSEKFDTVSFEPDPKYFQGGIFEVDGKLYIAFINDGGITHGIIAHECKHLTNRIFSIIYQKLDAENDELECYFLEFIIDQVYGALAGKIKFKS